MRKFTTKLCPNCNKEFATRRRDQRFCSYICSTKLRQKLEPRPAIYQPETDTYLIPLTKGYHAVIDACDVDISERRWVAKLADYTVYVARERERIHRTILSRMLGRDLLPSEFVDHINGNGLDNRRSNLRLATRSQNGANRRRKLNGKSPYKGIVRAKSRSGSPRWAARLRCNNKEIHLGIFDTPELAHAAYCEAAKKYHGEFANDGAYHKDRQDSDKWERE